MKGLDMSEPMYMQGDSIALSRTSHDTQEVECDCGALTEITVETQYHSVTRETTWWGEYTCPKCNETHDVEGWY
jgi:hypothetical protein